MLDLDAYLTRIGLAGGTPSLAALHRAHVTSIPFDGLDPHVGRPVSLDADALGEKLIRRRRGGYCFEQNMLLKLALEAFGYEAEAVLARTQIGLRPGEIRPRTHMLLRVRRDGETWHADVGFGSSALLEPLPWGPAGEHVQAGWRFRTVDLVSEWMLQTFSEGAWRDLYAFRPEPVPLVDVEMSNWWTSTHPESRFITGFLVSRQWLDGRRLVLSDWGQLALADSTPSQTTRTPLTLEQVPEILAERFELPGFVLGSDGRLAREDASDG